MVPNGTNNNHFFFSTKATIKTLPCRCKSGILVLHSSLLKLKASLFMSICLSTIQSACQACQVLIIVGNDNYYKYKNV